MGESDKVGVITARVGGGAICQTQEVYTPYEGLNLANQIWRKLGVFDRKLEGSYFIFLCYFDIILEIQKR